MFFFFFFLSSHTYRDENSTSDFTHKLKQYHDYPPPTTPVYPALRTKMAALNSHRIDVKSSAAPGPRTARARPAP